MTLDKKQHTASVGLAGCVGLLSLLLVSLVTPLTSGQAHAEEVENTNEETEGEVDANVDESVVDGDVETYAATASTVTISFSPSNASGSVTPIDSTNGDKAKVDVQATVSVQNSGGYSVYVGSSSSDLKNGTNTIPSVTTATSYANLPLNRWGYSFRKANSSTDKAISDTYSAMPATLRSSALDQNTSTSITSETRYYMLSFAARIGSDKPAGTYTNSVTMSVVSSPLEITNKFGVDNMQDMTSPICSGVASGTSDQLKDKRDGKYYWVSKLGDGKCWMTQNLDLDIPAGGFASDTETAGTPTSPNYSWKLSDMTAAWKNPSAATADSATSSTILADNTGSRSWSLGNVRITNPNTSSDCGSAKNSAANCTSQFTSYTTPTSQDGQENAHYILGNHYQWNAATAGTGGAITSGTASSSICPKGWRLPTSAEYTALVTALGGTSTTDNVTKAPFYGVRGGYVGQSTTYLFYGAGSYGYYWSSTPYSSASYAYYLRFRGTTSVNPSDYNPRQYGFSVRCIAK